MPMYGQGFNSQLMPQPPIQPVPVNSFQGPPFSGNYPQVPISENKVGKRPLLPSPSPSVSSPSGNSLKILPSQLNSANIRINPKVVPNKKNSSQIRPSQPPLRPTTALNNHQKQQSSAPKSDASPKPDASVDPVKEELGIDEEYMKKLEEQKRLRQEIEKQKAQKRKEWATLSTLSASSNQGSAAQSTDAPGAKRLCTGVAAPNKGQPIGARKQSTETQPANPSPNPSPNLKSAPVLGNKNGAITSKPSLPAKSSVVKVSGLSDTVRESAIRKLARPYGMVKSIEFNNHHPPNRYALVHFEQVLAAQKFVSGCQNQTIDDCCTISLSFNWFVLTFY